jgi:hypothetical protein
MADGVYKVISSLVTDGGLEAVPRDAAATGGHVDTVLQLPVAMRTKVGIKERSMRPPNRATAPVTSTKELGAGGPATAR